MTAAQDMIRGRSNIVTLTNNSGGALVAGDVCVQDATGDEYVTTTTSAASVLKVFIAAESIASAATGKFYESGYCPLVNVNASVTRGRFLFTHTVAKQAAENATYGAGAFGKILKSGTAPSAIIYSATAQSSGGGAGSDTTAIHNNVSAEINAITLKATPVSGDLLLIEDSTASNAKKRITVGSISSASAPTHAYFSQMAALLEPDALEAVQIANFTYVIATNATKYMIGSWATQIGGAGRVDLRRPSTPWQPLPLRGVTVTGTVNSAPSRSTAIFLDPTLPTYTDAWTTFYDRLNTIATTQTKVVHIAADSTRVMLLPGAYGAILLHNTSFNFTWLSPTINSDSNGWALENELGDASGNYQRVGANIMVPIHKWTCNGILSGISTGSTGAPFATVAYMLCPSTWSKVTDSRTYDFRDDFMGASLDTATKWTRAQSTVGYVEIDTAHQWLKIRGDSNWGNNGCYSQASITKAANKVFLCDLYCNANTSGNTVMVGFSAGTGQSYTDFAYGILFSSGTTSTLTVFENGNNRGTVGNFARIGSTYRIRITCAGSGTSGATYEIQGGVEYAAMGGATWTNITPGTSSSATTTLHAGVTSANNSTADAAWISDVRIY